MGIVQKLQERNAKNQEVLRKIMGDSCGVPSPTRQWSCILPKNHTEKHTAVVKCVWLKNKEEYMKP